MSKRQATCSVEGCERKHKARGWCDTHYMRWRRTGDPGPAELRRILDDCSIEGCDRPHYARRWCNLHWERWQVHGDPRWEPPTAADRFWAKVDKRGPHECWLWTARTTRDGYGQFQCSGYGYAHRFAYELLVGPIPEGLHLHHTCGQPLCVNPTHLEPVSPVEHLRLHGVVAARIAAMASRTTCTRGHPKDVYGYHNGKCWNCRECRRLWDARRRARLRASAG